MDEVSANPFRVLGLTPEVLRRLRSEEHVRTVALAMYRALSRLLHPDVGGSPAKFRELARARAMLDDPAQFTPALEAYLRPRRDRVSDLTEAVEASALAVLHVQTMLGAYLASIAAVGGLPLRPYRMLLIDSVTEDRVRQGLRAIRSSARPDRRYLEAKFGTKQISTRALTGGRQVDSPDRSEGLFLDDDALVHVVKRGRAVLQARTYSARGAWRAAPCTPVGFISLSQEGDYRGTRSSFRALVGDAATDGYGTFGWSDLAQKVEAIFAVPKAGALLVCADRDDRDRLHILGEVVGWTGARK